MDLLNIVWVWEHLVNDVVNCHVSTRRVKAIQRSLPWMNNEIRKAMNKRYKLLRLCDGSQASYPPPLCYPFVNDAKAVSMSIITVTRGCCSHNTREYGQIAWNVILASAIPNWTTQGQPWGGSQGQQMSLAIRAHDSMVRIISTELKKTCVSRCQTLLRLI